MSPKSSSINTFQQESVETPDTAKKRLWDSEQPQKPSYKRTRARIAELDEEVQSLQPSTQRETCDLAAKLDRLENENRKLHRVLEAIKVAVAEDEDGDKSYENDTSDRSRKISLEPPNAYYGEGVDVVSLLYEGLLSFDPKTPHESSIHPRPERVPITIPPTMLHPIPRKINQIYEYVFRISNGDAREVENADPGLIFKAINEGWETLHAKTMQNPLFLILFHIDQRIFYQQQKVTRLAILYKDLNLFKYYVNPSKRNLKNLPSWIQPELSQMGTECPVTINFFPWPHVRKILAENPVQYSSSTEFSTEFRRCFRFYWPFPFHNTFSYDQSTRKYRVNPLFDRYYRNQRSWGIDRSFFQRFPEFAEGFESLALQA